MGAFQSRVMDIVYWAVMTVIAVVWCLFEWVRYWMRIPYTPVLLTIFAGLIIAVASWRIRRIQRELAPLQMAIRGERTIGQLLETLRVNGYRVFHDLEEVDYNIDHVIIGPAGVFSIETKTRSKPLRGNAIISFDGQNILVNGFKPDRDPVVQSMAAARRVRTILLEQTGIEISVNPVVVFPGWFVEGKVKTKEIVVANEGYFLKWISGRGRELSDQQINALAAGIDRYQRLPAS